MKHYENGMFGQSLAYQDKIVACAQEAGVDFDIVRVNKFDIIIRPIKVYQSLLVNGSTFAFQSYLIRYFLLKFSNIEMDGTVVHRFSQKCQKYHDKK